MKIQRVNKVLAGTTAERARASMTAPDHVSLFVVMELAYRSRHRADRIPALPRAYARNRRHEVSR
jgi:hypothetical protein